jgi:hypothetical protein
MWLVDEIFRPVSGLILLSGPTATRPFPSKDSGGVTRCCHSRMHEGVTTKFTVAGAALDWVRMTDTSFPFHCELTQHLKMRAQFSDEPENVNEFSNPDV